MPNSYKRNHGFTLLEMLIAIALLVIMLTLLFNSLFTIGRSWNSGYLQISTNDDYRQINRFINRYLSQALAIEWRKGNTQKLIFSGDEHEITFMSPLPAHRGGGGLAVIRFAVSRGKNNSLIMRYEYADPKKIDTILSAGPENETILIENLKTLDIVYFGAKKNNEPEEWHSNWLDAELMPKLVKIVITLSDRSKNWPEMITPLNSQPMNSFPEFIITTETER